MSQIAPAPQTVATRIEKLCFLLQELALAAALANHATHSDMARMVSRHVAVRIPDFIGHLRQLRNCLAPSPASSDLKATINAFEAEFEAHLSLARHKLGAHVQDIDFLQRNDLWASIDAPKIDYFVRGAQELWDGLGALNAAGHKPFATPEALAEPGLASALHHLARSVAIPVTFGTDALAFSRANTLTVVNGTPVHQRAGQLALLRRWIRAEQALFTLFEPYAPVMRILKARLLTDFASFHDCLITREVAPGAPQQMEGLDKLVAAAGKSPTAISALAASNHEESTINPIRRLRNRIGGHLEIDPAIPLPALIAELDAFDMDRALLYYERLEAAFIQTCRQVHFLGAHLIDGQEVGGVLAKPSRGSPFDPARPDGIAGPPPHPTYSDSEMKAELARWAGGTGPFARQALEYFRNAFSVAPEAARRVRIEQIGSSSRYHYLTIRTSHLFIRDALERSLPDEEGGLLALVSSCPGFPAELTDILVEYHSASGRPASPALLAAFGRLAPWWFEDARAIVEDAIRTGGADHLLARMTLLQIYLREEAPIRTNRRPSHVEWSDVRGAISADIPAVERLAALVVLASVFIGRDCGFAIRKFDLEFRELTDAALAVARERLAGTLDAERDAKLQYLLHTGHFAQAVHCVVATGPRGHVATVKDRLLQAFGSGLIETCRLPQEDAAVAECLLLINATESALAMLESLSRTEPGNVEYPLRSLEILAGIDGMGDLGRTMSRQIREQFVLEAAAQARLEAAERLLDPR